MMQFTNKIKTFFKEVVIEGKKVDWPSKQEVARYTAIVIASCIAVALFLGLADYLFLRLMRMFII